MQGPVLPCTHDKKPKIKPIMKDYMHELDPALAQFSVPDIKEEIHKIKPKDIRASNNEFWKRDDDSSTIANKFVF